MDYMEAVKKLEEKLVLNQQKHENGGLGDGKCNGEVVASSIISCIIFVFLKNDHSINC